MPLLKHRPLNAPVGTFKPPKTSDLSSATESETSSKAAPLRAVYYPVCRGATQSEILQQRWEKRRDIDYHQPPSSALQRKVDHPEDPLDDQELDRHLPVHAAIDSEVPLGEVPTATTTNNTEDSDVPPNQEIIEPSELPSSIVSRYPLSLHGKVYFQAETDGALRHESVGIVIIDAEECAISMFDRRGRRYGNRPDPGYPLKPCDVERAKAGEVMSVGGRRVLLTTALCEDVFRSGSFFLTTEHELRIKEEKAKAKEAAEKEKLRLQPKMSFGGGLFSAPLQFRKRPRDGTTGFHVPLAGRPKHNAHGVLIGGELRPLHDPDREKAVVLFRANYKRDIAGRQQVSVVVDPVIGDKLRPHQCLGVKFLYDCIVGKRVEGYHGAILADEMGLGKTIQTVALIYTALKQGNHGVPIARKCMVVTPSSLVKNWCCEFDKWLGEGAVRHFAIAESTPKSDRIISRFDGEGDVLVISYDQLRKHIPRLSKLSSVELVVCDEGHRLKNAEVKTTKAVDLLPTKQRIILSGTPIQNDLSEFHAMVNFVNPGVLGDRDLFARVFEEPILAGRDPEAEEALRGLGRDRASYLSTLTQKFILRRTQTINEKYLPPKVDITVFVRLGEQQERAYRQLSEYMDKKDGASGSCRPLVLISALRKLCNHLDLFADAVELSHRSPVDNPNEEKSSKRSKKNQDHPNGIPRCLIPSDYAPGNLTQRSGSKIFFVSLMLDQLLRQGGVGVRDKLVIVSNFTQTLDIIAALCEKKKVRYFQLDGSTPINKRQELVDQFNYPQAQELVFLLSSKAGGVGLNLIGANRLILFDPDWNPANDAQAMGRVWRDGQKKRVYIYRLLSTGTIEEKVYQRQVSKQGLSANVVDMQTDSKQHFTLEELKSLFTFKANTLSDTHDLLHCSSCEGVEKEKQSMKPSGFRKVAGEGSKSAARQSGPRMDELKAWRHIREIPKLDLDTVTQAMSRIAPQLISFLFVDERDNQKKALGPAVDETAAATVHSASSAAPAAVKAAGSDATGGASLTVEKFFTADMDTIVCASQAAIEEQEQIEDNIEIISDEDEEESYGSDSGEEASASSSEESSDED